ncbi:hypothetical protein LTS18_011266 [Coniosporium uncinatum]|uniref:Uncharacterized protein n=1 Tax=Coniosporium uncinatum TaxID=93489 RepID=A0ACC3CYN5_9PEZI|nr:hypothetical protein LTS18_011266 [Coniosporium uncinatum]
MHVASQIRDSLSLANTCRVYFVLLSKSIDHEQSPWPETRANIGGRIAAEEGLLDFTQITRYIANSRIATFRNLHVSIHVTDEGLLLTSRPHEALHMLIGALRLICSILIADPPLAPLSVDLTSNVSQANCDLLQNALSALRRLHGIKDVAINCSGLDHDSKDALINSIKRPTPKLNIVRQLRFLDFEVRQLCCLLGSGQAHLINVLEEKMEQLRAAGCARRFFTGRCLEHDVDEEAFTDTRKTIERILADWTPGELWAKSDAYDKFVADNKLPQEGA